MRRGFTLLELLVATGLSSTLLLTLAAGLRMGGESSKTVAEELQASRDAHFLAESFRRDFASIIPATGLALSKDDVGQLRSLSFLRAEAESGRAILIRYEVTESVGFEGLRSRKLVRGVMDPAELLREIEKKPPLETWPEFLRDAFPNEEGDVVCSSLWTLRIEKSGVDFGEGSHFGRVSQESPVPSSLKVVVELLPRDLLQQVPPSGDWAGEVEKRLSEAPETLKRFQLSHSFAR